MELESNPLEAAIQPSTAPATISPNPLETATDPYRLARPVAPIPTTAAGGAPAPALPANTINAADLSSTKGGTLETPPALPNTASGGLAAMASSVGDEYKTNRQAEIDALTKSTDASVGTQGKLITALGDTTASRADLEASGGANDAKKAADEIQSQMEKRNLYYTRRIEDLQANNPGGTFGGALQDEIDKLTHENAREQADFAISLSARNRQYDTAEGIVNAKVTAETEKEKAQLQAEQLFYTTNEARLSDKQKEVAQERITESQHTYEDAKALRTDVNNVLLEAAKNGAPPSLLTKIGNSQTATAAISTAGGYIGLLDREKAQQDLTNGANGGTTFSKSQINNGAATAGIPLSTFQGFDADTKNFFINGDIGGAKKSIDSAFSTQNASLTEVNSTIDSMGLPKAGADYLKKYAAESIKTNAPQTPAGRITELQTQGYSRKEAEQTATDELSNGGKITLPAVIKTQISDGLDAAYGKQKSLWQKITGQ